MGKGKEIVLASLRSKALQQEAALLGAIRQLTEEDLRWRPNPESNSIVNLVEHIAGFIHQRIEVSVWEVPLNRNREKEFSHELSLSAEETLASARKSLAIWSKALHETGVEDLKRTVEFRGKTITLLETFLQVNDHLSEHIGQIIYAAKLRLGARYVSAAG